MQHGATNSCDGGFCSGGHLDGKIPFAFISAQAVFDPFVLYLYQLAKLIYQTFPVQTSIPP